MGQRKGWQSDATVTEHVHRLRQKLGLRDGRPMLHTVRGVGYRMGQAVTAGELRTAPAPYSTAEAAFDLDHADSIGLLRGRPRYWS